MVTLCRLEISTSWLSEEANSIFICQASIKRERFCLPSSWPWVKMVNNSTLGNLKLIHKTISANLEIMESQDFSKKSTFQKCSLYSFRCILKSPDLHFKKMLKNTNPKELWNLQLGKDNNCQRIKTLSLPHLKNHWLKKPFHLQLQRKKFNKLKNNKKFKNNQLVVKKNNHKFITADKVKYQLKKLNSLAKAD